MIESNILFTGSWAYNQGSLKVGRLMRSNLQYDVDYNQKILLAHCANSPLVFHKQWFYMQMHISYCNLDRVK